MGFPWEEDWSSSGWSPGSWDLSSLEVTEDTIAEAFGRRMTLSQLLDLLSRYGSGKLSNVELVDLIHMGIHFMRTSRGWTLAPNLLEHWLVAGATPDRLYQVDTDVFKDGLETWTKLCSGGSSVYDVIRGGIEKRLRQHPYQNAAITSIRDEKAKFLNVPASTSVLAQGGTEVLYKEQGGVLIANKSSSDRYNAIGAFALVSAVTVTSTVVPAGGWDVTIDSWEVWAWDRYDWHSGLSVKIPINVLDNLGVPQEQQGHIRSTLQALGMDTSLLDEIVVGDKTMSALEAAGKFTDGAGKPVHAGPFWVVGRSTWMVDPTATDCGRDRAFHVDP